jgi:hypothetical protein
MTSCCKLSSKNIDASNSPLRPCRVGTAHHHFYAAFASPLSPGRVGTAHHSLCAVNGIFDQLLAMGDNRQAMEDAPYRGAVHCGPRSDVTRMAANGGRECTLRGDSLGDIVNSQGEKVGSAHPTVIKRRGWGQWLRYVFPSWRTCNPLRGDAPASEPRRQRQG